MDTSNEKLENVIYRCKVNKFWLQKFFTLDGIYFSTKSKDKHLYLKADNGLWYWALSKNFEIYRPANLKDYSMFNVDPF